MIREAELFVQADRALVGLVSRIRDDQWHLLLPPVFDMPGAGGAGRLHDGRGRPRHLRRRPARRRPPRPGNRRRHVLAVEGAKAAETRARRVAKVVDELRG